MMRYFILTSLLIVLTQCNQKSKQQEYSAEINGRFHQYPVTMVYLQEITVEGRDDIDSMLTDHEGGFYFSFPVKETGFFVITHGEKTMPLVLMVEGGDEIKLECEDAYTQTGSIIEGSSGSLIIRDYYLYTGRNRDIVDSMRLVLEIAKGDENFLDIRRSLDSSYAIILEEQRSFTKGLIEANMGSLVSIFLSNQRFGPNRYFSFENDLSMYKDIDSILSINYPDNSHVIDQKNRMNEFIATRDEKAAVEKKLNPGNPAPVVSLPSIDGKIISMDSLKGNPVLIYFWAAYDAPSRKFNKRITEIASKYENSGLQLLAVSMDDRQPLWEGAIHLDKLDMRGIIINVSDLRGANSPLIKLFNLGDKLPVLYLLDEEGIILARSGNTDEIEKVLKEFLNP